MVGLKSNKVRKNVQITRHPKLAASQRKKIKRKMLHLRDILYCRKE